MTKIAIEFNDAALVAVGPDGMLGPGGGAEPGYAAVTGSSSLFGTAALRQARLRPGHTYNLFWRELSAAPMSATAGPYATAADLMHAHLQSLWQGWSAGVSGAIFVVPAYWSQEQLGLLLGIAEELAIPVIGLVDSAVAATCSRYETDDLLNIDASLHDVVVTRMKQDGGAAIESRQTIDSLGIERLERVCVEHIAACFLERTRFDPLHDATGEQALHDGLDEWLRSLQRSASVTATLDRDSDDYTVLIKRDELAAALATCCEPLMQYVRSRLTAGHLVAIQVSDRLAGFPGIIDRLDQLSQVTTFVLEPTAAARGALSRAGQFVKTNAGVPFKTSLRWDRAAVEVTVPGDAAQLPAGEDMPTHVLYMGRAWQIGSEPLTIGSELAPDEYGIGLSIGNRGISRRHCSIHSGLNGAELIDHSRFGTRLNGHVIDKAAVLRAGDVISIGEPSVDLRIITEITSQGSGDGT